MIDDQYTSSLDEPQPSNTTFDSGCDFNKYDPYVEKIRTLFVPSLEPRIYSCLETFVYREEQEAISETPYLRRCLDVAATWREPVDAFSTALGDPGFLENMLSQAVKYVIKDGLIDCFLNSIILNNRLNKVCRNLDAVGVEKDFLRCLAVWNYINERDYWIEDDRRISMSTSELSHASIDSHSDLDVQVGSVIDCRTDRCHKRASKRRAVDDTSDMIFKNPGDFLENRNSKNSSGLQITSRPSVDWSNPEVSKSSHPRRKPRSISQTNSCRPSNCPAYRSKNSHRDWEGMTLKLRVCKICPPTSESGPAKPLRLSKLPLPCKSHDVIAEIVKADFSTPKFSPIARRKKLQVGVINICRCVNETLEKMTAQEVRRCRLQCEILPGSIGFKLVRRESNGCKVCLFTDRVPIEKIDGQDGNIPRESSVGQKAENTEQNDSHDFNFPICESTRFSLPDENSQAASSLRASGNIVDDQTGDRDNFDGNNLDIFSRQSENVFEAEKTGSLDKNLPPEASLSHLSGNKIADQTCLCNNSADDNLDTFPRDTEKSRDTSSADSFEAKENGSVGKELAPEASLNRSSGNQIANVTCLCTSVPETLNVDHDFGSSIILSEPQKKSSKENEKIGSNLSVQNSQKVLMPQLNLSSSLPVVKSGNEIKMEIQLDELNCEINCECPDSCERIQKCNDKLELEECDSQCSCDSCGAPEKLISAKILGDDSEASLMNPGDPSKMIEPMISKTSLKPEVPDVPTLDIELKEIGSTGNSQKSLQTRTAKSEFSDIKEPKKKSSTIIKNSQHFDAVSNLNSQPNLLNSPANSWKSFNPKMPQTTIRKSKIPIESSVPVPFPDAGLKDIDVIGTTEKSLQTRSAGPDFSSIKEFRKTSSTVQPPISIETGKALSARSHRINISIELCPGSESSEEIFLKNLHEPIMSSQWQKDSKTSRCLQGSSSMWKTPRDSRASRKQAILESEKNTKDECLKHLRRLNGCLHSPPRPQESRDYLPPPETPSRMGNPILYGMSTKSCVRSTCKFEGRSTRHRGRGKKNSGSSYPKSNWNKRRWGEIQEMRQMEKPCEVPKKFPGAKLNSSSAMHSNICHAFSASSVDRMKHLIKTKLRRILLERDKATNTPKTSLTNDRYRVSVPNGKTKRSPFVGRQRCHTIWESRSATDSTTSRTFGSDGRRSFPGDEARNLFCSTKNSKMLSKVLDHKDLEGGRNLDISSDLKCDCLKNSESVVSSGIRMDQRLFGGSDDPQLKQVDREFQYWKQCQRSEQKMMSCMENSEVVGDASVKFSHLVVSDDCKVETVQNKGQEEVIKYPRRLDWSGNSTSRHIDVYDYNNIESSNDEEEKNRSHQKSSQKLASSLFSKQNQSQKHESSTKMRKTNQKRCKEDNLRRCKRRFSLEPNLRAPSIRSSKMPATSSIRCQKGLAKLDQDLRTKLLQYVSLCKNVKYSLLKMLRPDEVYEVSGTSAACSGRYKFGDS